MKRVYLWIILLFLPLCIYGQSLAKAEVLLENQLTREAQKELIDLIFLPGTTLDKPKALNLLASIAVDQNNYKGAISAWQKLIRLYPNTPEAIAAKRNLPLIASILGERGEEIVQEATARILLKNADFWSKDKSKINSIDASWIDEIQAAIFWYDKVIENYPGTDAARIAHEDKIRTLIGWKEIGSQGESYGVKKSPSYLPLLEIAFREYERGFPEATNIQGFRFQLAQAYWLNKNWLKTREFLTEIIKKDGDGNSFYRDLAERRLRKIEY